MKKGRERGEGVWLGAVSGLGTPDTPEDYERASFRRTIPLWAGSGFFRRPGPALLCVWGLFCVFCKAV
jgi:hypothetical protein